MSFNIAIDGPAGAGKSTIAKMIAKKENFIYVDTGAMYRAIGLYMLRNGIDINDLTTVENALPSVNVTISYEDGAQKVWLNGEDVSSVIRTQEVSNAASVTSSYPPVRAHLLMLQRKLAADFDVVMDGRDIGTVILPNADLKIFLTASSRVRAERRALENKEKGIPCDIDQIEKEIIERDERDRNREISPLRQADDAVLVDTSKMSIEEVVSHMDSLIDRVRKECL